MTLLGAALVATGCYAPVWTETYYLPDVPEATRRPYRCGGGPENIATVMIDGVSVGYALYARRDGVDVVISLQVPSGHSARFLEPSVVGGTHAGDHAAAALGAIQEGWQRLAVERPQPLAVDAVMQGRNREGSPGREPALFIASTRLRVPAADELTVSYPSLAIDDRIVARREIRFTRQRHTQVLMPLNC